ncbi:MAG: 50S ribosomal protein L4 [Chlamydiae bacterium]|nr:50S ribosomal protein L4 [Chlamydiota bacterium]
MATFKKYDFSGKENGQITIEDEHLNTTADPQMIKDYIVAHLANQRQWSANTKGRSEVNATGAKPHKQKGLGRARQGCLAAPQYRGGGRVFGPKPKFDQHVKVNHKQKRIAISYFLSEKLKNNNAVVLELSPSKVSKTKEVVSFFKNIGLSGKRVLVLTKAPIEEFKRCARNIQKVEFASISNLNGYNLALCQDIVFVDMGVEDLKKVLS